VALWGEKVATQKAKLKVADVGGGVVAGDDLDAMVMGWEEAGRP
jgi:hypothetical protein